MATKQNDENKKNTDSQLDSSTSGFGNSLPIQKQSNINYRKEKTNINSLEIFAELVENDIFKPNNYKRIKYDISNQERNTLKDKQKDTSKTCRIQDKGSRFVVLDSDSDIEKIDRQPFKQLDYKPSDKFCKKLTSWDKKCKQNKVLDNSWCRFIATSHANPRQMYGLIKTHKVGNPVRVITSGCGTAKENFSISCYKMFISRSFKN